MTIKELEIELKLLDKDLSILPNQNNPEMASIQYKGQHLLSCPGNNIYEEPREEYGVATGGGTWVRHRTKGETINIVNALLIKISSDKDYRDALLGEGEYA